MNYRAAVLCAVLALTASPVSGQTVENLLVVVNTASQESRQIADYYVKARHVPERHVVTITSSTADSITRAEYLARIEGPIAAWISRERLQDRVLYIVLTKGVPLRIAGTGGVSGTTSSVDSELTLLYRRMTGADVPILGRVDNPFFLGDAPLSEAKRFSRATSDLYLVTRLDGFSVDDVFRLIDRGLKPAVQGQIVLDQRATVGDRGGDFWLFQAAERLAAMDKASWVTLDTTRDVATTTQPVLGYFGWGSNDPANQLRATGLRFVNGAIGGQFVSTDGRTFREPSAAWRPAPAGSTTGGQSLIGDLIREGITGVTGHVSEPYLDAIARPQILFPAYLSGFNLAEAYYLGIPYLSWQNLVIGDPLCSPFPAASPVPLESTTFDPETELPSLFARRSLDAMRSLTTSTDALKSYLKALSLEAQGRPQAEVEALLTKATEIDPRLPEAQMRLAQWATARQEFDKASERYRAVLSVRTDDVVAMNNLAFLLAERLNSAAEALPLAERAYRLSSQVASVGDTLGWVYYRLGRISDALPVLDRAAKLEPDNSEILIHAATAHADVNSLVKARGYLDAALKANPALADKPEIKALVSRIR